MAFNWGAFAGQGISALGQLAGGLFGSSSEKDEAKKARRFAEKQFDESKRQFNLQRSYTLNRIYHTVTDAKNAGIHPLAALGASTPGGFSGSVAGVSPMGGSGGIGNAVAGGAMALGDAVGDLYRDDAMDELNERDAAERRSQYEDMQMQRILEEQRQIGLDERAAKSQDLRDRLTQEEILRTRAETAATMARAAAQGGATPMATSGDGILEDGFGGKWDTKGLTPAEDAERVFGDLGDSWWGFSNMLNSWWNTGATPVPIPGRKSYADTPPPKANYRGRLSY